MAARTEVAIQPSLLTRILSLAGGETILVGGQALAFWSSYFGIEPPPGAVTKDADFLGSRADVERIARGLGGQAHYPPERAQTALTGQVTKDLPGNDYINIDILFRMHGATTMPALRARAVQVQLDAATFKILHPMDVLQSRLENLYSLPEKQDEHAVAQLRLAIAMGRAFLAAEAARGTGNDPKARRPVVLKHLGRIAAMARSDAGRKVARRFDVHVADTITAQAVLGLRFFVARELPLLAPLMSKPWRSELRLQSG